MERKGVAQRIAEKHREENPDNYEQEKSVDNSTDKPNESQRAPEVNQVPDQSSHKEPVTVGDKSGEQAFDWNKINEVTGGQFEDIEGFKTFFEDVKGKAGKVTEYETTLNDYKSQVEEYKAMSEWIEQNEGKYDPRNMFGGEENFKRALLSEALKKNKVNANVVDRILDPSFKDMDSLDIIAVGQQLKNARLTGQEEAIKRSVLKQIGVDLEQAKEDGLSTSEIIKNLTPEQRVELDYRAGEIVDNVNSLIEKVELPEVADPIKKILDDKKARQESVKSLAETWQSKEVADGLSKSLDEINIDPEGLDVKFKIGDAEKVEIIKGIVARAALTGKQFNEENVSSLIAQAKQEYIGKNSNKIFAAVAKQAELRFKEQTEKDVFNGTKSNMDSKPQGGNQEQSPVEAYRSQRSKKAKGPKRLM